MEERFCIGDAGKKGAHGAAVAAYCGVAFPDDLTEVKPVGFEEGAGEQRCWDLEADVLEVGRGGETAFAELIDVEGELRSDMGVRVLRIVDDGTVFFGEFRKFDGDGRIDHFAMADAIGDVVGEGADGEGEFIGRFGVTEQALDEVAGADVVGEIGEENVAKGIVAGVLNGATTVGVGVCLL